MKKLYILIAIILTGFMFFIIFDRNSDRVYKDLENVEIKDSEVEAAGYKDMIRLETPKEGDEITSPLKISGDARGNWYFEADFPVLLTDWDGRIMAETLATAQGDWMTEEYVPFSAELEFEKPELYEQGTLILRKDNPSGLPEHDDAYEIDIIFK